VGRSVVRAFDWLLDNVLVGVLVLVLTFTGVGILVFWLTRDSEAEYVTKAVQEQSRWHVDDCRQVATSPGSDGVDRIFRCRITAPTCVRRFRFVDYAQHMYGVAPYSASDAALNDPCTFN
jgi:hypothetical protein